LLASNRATVAKPTFESFAKSLTPRFKSVRAMRHCIGSKLRTLLSFTVREVAGSDTSHRENLSPQAMIIDVVNKVDGVWVRRDADMSRFDQPLVVTVCREL
jgi:hypothetical protein